MSIISGKYTRTIHVPGSPEASVANYIVTPEDNGTWFTTSGNLHGFCIFRLPPAQAGLEYGLTIGTSSGGDSVGAFEAATGDRIWWPFVSGGYLGMYGITYNHSFRVRAYDDTGWYTILNFGGWTGY